MVSKVFQAALGAKADAFDVAKLKLKLQKARKERQKEESFKKKTSFAPSALGYAGACPRYWYYAFNGAMFKRNGTPTGQAAMDSGTDRHERIESEYQALADDGELDAVEIEKELLYDDPPIRSYADTIVTMDGVTAIGDVKNVNTEKFNLIVQRMKPVPSHVLQVLIYMRIRDLRYGYIHYEDKNSHEDVLFPITMTPRLSDYIDKVFDWMRAVKHNADHGELPTRAFAKDSMNCKYCPIFEQCWKKDSDRDGAITIEPLKMVAL